MKSGCIERNTENRPSKTDASYFSWNFLSRKEEIGINDNSRLHYKFHITVLEFIRAVLPGNVKDEIWDGPFEVSREEFCCALNIKEKCRYTKKTKKDKSNDRKIKKICRQNHTVGQLKMPFL